MVIRTAIVEDDPAAVVVLKEYLTRYEKENAVHFQVDVFTDGMEIVSDYQPVYHIIFLDIQLKHMNGMETAEKIRSMDEEAAFIFVTSTIQFAVQGYLVDAVGYVLKPVPWLAFSQILKKAVSRIEKKENRHTLSFEVEGGKMRVNLSQIYYIESQLHHILVHSEKGDYLTLGPLKKFEKALEDKSFVKCHNAYLVNLSHITGIMNNTAVLSNGEKLSISRTRKKLFMDRLTDFVGGVV